MYSDEKQSKYAKEEFIMYKTEWKCNIMCSVMMYIFGWRYFLFDNHNLLSWNYCYEDISNLKKKTTSLVLIVWANVT